MKKAFTMIELVFVIVIVGIISVMIAPSFQRNTLQEAVDQVVSHIRYTQHLAMMDNKFDRNDQVWYRKTWQIRFVKDLSFTNTTCGVIDYDDIWSYMIYSNESCTTPTCNTNPNKSETAKSPLNVNTLLSGGYNNDLCVDNSKNQPDMLSSDEMRLGSEYGIDNITFSGGCRSNINYISFDYIGRPFNSFPTNSPYEIGSPGWHKLLTQSCNITLSSGSDTKTIVIEPETGYTHIL